MRRDAKLVRNDKAAQWNPTSCIFAFPGIIPNRRGSLDCLWNRGRHPEHEIDSVHVDLEATFLSGPGETESGQVADAVNGEVWVQLYRQGDTFNHAKFLH